MRLLIILLGCLAIASIFLLGAHSSKDLNCSEKRHTLISAETQSFTFILPENIELKKLETKAKELKLLAYYSSASSPWTDSLYVYDSTFEILLKNSPSPTVGATIIGCKKDLEKNKNRLRDAVNQLGIADAWIERTDLIEQEGFKLH